jgi:hypothetical protein
MRKARFILLIVPVVLFAAGQKKTETKPAAAKTEQAPPAGAEQVETNLYRHTDAQGKTWLYRRTPFGLVKMEEKAGEKRSEPIPEGMTAVEEGDSIRFERPSPFGKYRWVRKKTELTELERAVWDRQREKTESTPPAGQE